MHGCQVALHRLHPPQPVRRGDLQRVARCGRGEATPSRPRGGATKRIVQQRSVGVDQDPVLPSADDRRQEAKQAAGSGAKIEQARSLRKSIGQPPRKRRAACGVVERFAQREPVRVELLRHPASASANFLV
jgi:hypothetical protein